MATVSLGLSAAPRLWNGSRGYEVPAFGWPGRWLKAPSWTVQYTEGALFAF